MLAVVLSSPLKRGLLTALIGLLMCSDLFAAEPARPDRSPVLVCVHGAWGGGWQFKQVATLLEAKGWQVYRPSLSGLGEHYQTANADIGLSTHIDDIVNLILFEDLHDVILLGHSYGGMVITGVADRMPERIARLIYLDAFVPESGESVVSYRKPGDPPIEPSVKDGLYTPAWVRSDRPLPRLVPQPFKTFTEPLVLRNPALAKIPATYILTVDKGRKPEDDTFFRSKERAHARGWPVTIMEANHYPMQLQPEATADLLLGIR